MFNRPEYIDSLFQSIAMQTPIDTPFEVIVVDNTLDGSDILRQIVNRWSGKLHISVVHVAQNGLHYARHAGAKIAKGDVLIFIDDDVLLPSNWLSVYDNFFKRKKGICAGGKVIPEWEVQIDSWINQIPDYFSLLDYGDSELVLEIRQGINGCNFAIKKEAIFNFGGFHPDGYADPSLQWFRGDGEYGLIQKIKKAGYDIYYLPTALLIHRIPRSRTEPQAIQKIVVNHAISSSFSYVRKNKASFFSVIILIIGGLFCGISYYFLHLLMQGRTGKMIIYYKCVKYFTTAQYGLKILTQPILRDYVIRETYL